jgi:hypothetical protein
MDIVTVGAGLALTARGAASSAPTVRNLELYFLYLTFPTASDLSRDGVNCLVVRVDGCAKAVVAASACDKIKVVVFRGVEDRADRV